MSSFESLSITPPKPVVSLADLLGDVAMEDQGYHKRLDHQKNPDTLQYQFLRLLKEQLGLTRAQIQEILIN